MNYYSNCRVAAVECKSSNTAAALSEEEYTPKPKRRKADKNESPNQSVAKLGGARTAAATRSMPTETANRQVKPLAKVANSSSKCKASGCVP